MSFQSNLKTIRHSKGLKQKEASDLLGIKIHNLSAYEEGRSEPNISSLEKILAAYEVPPAQTHKFLFGNYKPRKKKVMAEQASE
jgi:transcriptional regulator with XRE-family HTH domain